VFYNAFLPTIASTAKVTTAMPLCTEFLLTTDPFRYRLLEAPPRAALDPVY